MSAARIKTKSFRSRNAHKLIESGSKQRSRMVRHPLLRSRAAPHAAEKQFHRSPAFLAWRGRRARACIFAIGLSALAMPAHAQANLEAGKSPAQIFADTCNACHRSPREVKRTTAAFLREHYTTGMREAAMMAGFLASVGSDPQAVQQRRPPTLGAGQPATRPQDPAGLDQPRPSAQVALPASSAAVAPIPSEQAGSSPPGPRSRRPSDSMELGGPTLWQSDTLAARKSHPVLNIEE
jgi:hypothetical protein